MEQLALDLPTRPALGREAFLVGSSNATALAQVEDPGLWPGGRLALVGPAGSGKTHLAHVLGEIAGARILDAASLPDDASGLAGVVVVEDVDRLSDLPADRRAAAETALFHLHNTVLETGGRLMVTGRSAPAAWDLMLPDLASRLRAAGVARLEPPDDALLTGVIVKLFADRGIRAGGRLVDYLVRRIDRAIPAAAAVVARLDAAALARGRPVTRELAAEVLDAPG